MIMQKLFTELLKKPPTYLQKTLQYSFATKTQAPRKYNKKKEPQILDNKSENLAQNYHIIDLSVNQKSYENKMLQNIINPDETECDQQKNLQTLVDWTLDSQEAIKNQIEMTKVQMHEEMSITLSIFCGKLFGRLNHEIGEDWVPILKSLKSNMAYINHRNLTEVLWILAKCPEKEYKFDIYEELQAKVLQHIENFKSDDLALTTWSYAKYKYGTETFWNSLLDNLVPSVNEMNSVDLSNICWSLSKIIEKHENLQNIDQLWDSMESLIIKTPEKFQEEQSFSILIASFAKANKGSQLFWNTMGQSFQQTFHHLSNQGIAHSIWALGRKNIIEISNWIEIEALIISKLNSYQDQEIIAIAWGCTKMQMGTKNFWNKILKKIEQFLSKQQFEPKDYPTLSSCTYVISHLNTNLETQWNLLQSALIQILESPLPESESETQPKPHLEIAQFNGIIAGFSLHYQGTPKLWSLFQKEAKSYLKQHIDLKTSPENKHNQTHKLDSKSLSNLIYGFNNHSQVSQAFKDLYLEAIQNETSSFSLQGLLVCLSSCVKQGILNKFIIKRDQNLQKITDEILLNIWNKRQEFQIKEPRDLAMLLYSLAKLSYQNSEIIVNLLKYFETEIQNTFQENKNMQIKELDLAHIVMGFNQYEVASPQFWNFLEKQVLAHLYTLQEQNASIFLRIGNKRFSDQFFRQFQQLIEQNIKKYRPIMLINIINVYRDSKQATQESYLIIEKNILFRLERNELTLFQIAEIAQSLSKTQMGSHNFWFKCVNAINNQFSEEMKKINLNNIEQRQIFPMLLDVASNNLQLRNQSDLYDLIIEGSKQIIFSKYIKVKELVNFVRNFATLKIGDNYMWGILERKIVLFLPNMNVNHLMGLLLKMKGIHRGSPQLYERCFQHFVERVDSIFFDVLQKYAVIPSALQQRFLSLYAQKLVIKSQDQTLETYITNIHTFVNLQTLEEVPLIVMLGKKDFSILQNDFEAQIFHLHHTQYTMKINQILKAFEEKKNQKIMVNKAAIKENSTENQGQSQRKKQKIHSKPTNRPFLQKKEDE